MGCMGPSARVRLTIAAIAGKQASPRPSWLPDPASKGVCWPTGRQGYVHGPLAVSPGGKGASSDLLRGSETGVDPLVGR